MAKKRMGNIELLRVLSMLFVVTLHFLGRGGVTENAVMYSASWYLSFIWDALAIVSVNVYVLISGYFLIKSEFKLQKIIDIVLAVFSYSFLLYIFSIVLGLNQFTYVGFIKAFFPLLTSQYWFASVYVGLYVLFPFINKGLNSMTKKEHFSLCVILTFLFALSLPSKTLGQNGYSIVWMVCLYVYGAYLRLYYTPSKKHLTNKFAIYLFSFFLLPISKIIIVMFAEKISPVFLKYSNYFYKNDSILVLFSAIALFVLFLNIELKNEKVSKFFSFVGSLTFGVYLCHNNPSIRDSLWQFIDLPKAIDKWWFVFYGIGVIFIIFVLSALVEYWRKKIYKKIVFSKIYLKLYKKIECCFSLNENNSTETPSFIFKK